MKINTRSKRRVANAPTYRTVYEPDHDHEAWHVEGPVPTPETLPEAFYSDCQQVRGLKEDRPSSRQQQRETLSLTALRKRLYRAGVRGDKVASVAREIKAGPGPLGLDGQGTWVMGWPIDRLERQFGRRIARAVSCFVRRKIVVVDEAWHLLKNIELPAYARKFNAGSVTVQQDVSLLAAAH